MKQKLNPVYCKRLRYGSKKSPIIVLGLILEETEEFIKFRTGKNDYQISKKLILSIEDTKQIFREG